MPFFIDDLFSAPKDIKGGSLNDEIKLTKSNSKVIYDIYDEPKEKYPEYVKKTELGKAFSMEISKYTFKNFSMENHSAFGYKPLKIVIVTSIHGYEQGCAWTYAQFFKLLCEDRSDKNLNYIRRNVQFEVIHVLNPWGFKHNDRKNGNQVDLNRNFSIGFTGIKDVESEIYPGTHPESEEETKIVTRFIEENLDATVVLDYHNIYGGYTLFYVYSEKDVQLANDVFSALTDKWVKEYPELPKDRILGLVRPNGNSGMFADYLISKNLWVLTMETPWCMPVIAKEQYDKTTIKCTLEVLVNTILAIIKNTH